MSARYATTVNGTPPPATQTVHPARTAARTVLQAAIALAAAAPLAHRAIVGQDPAAAAGALVVGLAVLVGATVLMAAAPAVRWARRYAPVLAPDAARAPRPARLAPAEQDPDRVPTIF